MTKQNKRNAIYGYCNQFALSECDKCILYDKWVGNTPEEEHCRAVERCSEKQLDAALKILGIIPEPVKKDIFQDYNLEGQMSFEDFPYLLPEMEA